MKFLPAAVQTLQNHWTENILWWQHQQVCLLIAKGISKINENYSPGGLLQSSFIKTTCVKTNHALVCIFLLYTFDISQCGECFTRSVKHCESARSRWCPFVVPSLKGMKVFFNAETVLLRIEWRFQQLKLPRKIRLQNNRSMGS